MKNRLGINIIGLKTLYFLLFVTTMFFACSEEEDPFTACISYDEIVKYTKGVKIRMSSCSEGAVSYKWEIEDSVYVGDEIEHTIFKSETDLRVLLTATDNNGNEAYESVRIDLEDLPYKVHSFDHSVFSIGNVGVKENQIFVKGYFENNQGTFGAYFNPLGNLQDVDTYENENLDLHLNNPLFYPSQEDFFTSTFERTERILSDQGYFFHELIIPRFDNYGKYQSRTLTLVPVAGNIKMAEKSGGYYIASDYVYGATMLSTVDKDGSLESSIEIKTELSEETDLVDFLKNEQGGYCFILQDEESRQFIRLDINEQGVKENEYLFPLADIPYNELRFYADGSKLIVTKVNGYSNTIVTIVNESSVEHTFYADHEMVKSIVDGGEGKYLLIDRTGNISLIGTSGVEYTIDYDPGDFKAAVRIGDSYYLIGRANSGFDKIPLYVFRIGLDGLVQ